MSALGQKRTFPNVRPMSALPPKADITECDWHVRFVPKADIAENPLYPGSGHTMKTIVLVARWDCRHHRNNYADFAQSG